MLDKDLLDPTVDLKPHLRATFDQISRQNGGRNDRVSQYLALARSGQSPADVMASSYDEQERRTNEALTAAMPQQVDVRRDPSFFSDAHLYDMDAPVGTPSEAGGFDTRGDSALPMPEAGGYDGRADMPARSGYQDVPIVQAQELVDSPRTLQIQDQINAYLSKPQQGFTPTPMPAPDSPSVVLTALAMLFAPPNQSSNILMALEHNQDAIRMRNDVLAKIHAQTANEEDKAKLEGLLRQLAREDAISIRRAQFQQDAEKANAGNQASLMKTRETQAGQTERLGMTLDSKKEIAEMNSAIRQRLIDLKDPIEQMKAAREIWPEATDAQRREIVYSLENKRIAETENKKANTKRTLEMIPIEVALGKSKIRLTDEQRNWIATKIEHYPEQLAMDAERAAQGWARLRLAEQALQFRQDKGATKEIEDAEETLYKVLDSQIKEAEAGLGKDFGKDGNNVGLSDAIKVAYIETLKSQKGEIAQRILERSRQTAGGLTGKVRDFFGGKPEPVAGVGGDIVASARKRLGVKYSMSRGKGTLDCSQLGQCVWKENGLPDPGSTTVEIEQFAKREGLWEPGLTNPEPGDLIMFDSPGNRVNKRHVGVYIGNGKMIDASSGRGKVVERPVKIGLGVRGVVKKPRVHADLGPFADVA